MAKVPNAVEILLKISTASVGHTSITDRQMIDGQATAYSSLKKAAASSPAENSPQRWCENHLEAEMYPLVERQS